MSLPVVEIAITGIVTSIVTHLADRKLFINPLKKQVEILQKENRRLQKIILEQQRQINELKIRYKALRLWAYKEKLEYNGLLKGKILFQYVLYEYLRLLKMQLNKINLSQEEQIFFEIFDRIVNNQFSDEEKLQAMYYLKEFIHSRYYKEIDKGVLPSVNQYLLELGVSNE